MIMYVYVCTYSIYAPWNHFTFNSYIILYSPIIFIYSDFTKNNLLQSYIYYIRMLPDWKMYTYYYTLDVQSLYLIVLNYIIIIAYAQIQK